MNRLLVPTASALLLAGCGQLPFFGPQSARPFDAGPDTVVVFEQTNVVREIHEVPVYYVDTVYYEGEPAPAETVVVVEEYDNYILVNEPPHPRPRRNQPRWSPGAPEPPEREHRGREPQPPDNSDPQPPPRGRREPDPRPGPDESSVKVEAPPRVAPQPVAAPAPVVVETPPVRPVPPTQPFVPVLQAPANDGGGESAPVAPARPARTPAGEATAARPQRAGQPSARGGSTGAEAEQSEGADQLADN